MKLINQSAEFLPQEAGLSGIYKQIELAGRTSYLSWDKMTDDSAKKFVDMLIKSKHTSVLEHGTVYLNIGNNLYDTEFEHNAYKWNSFIQKYIKNPYSKLTHNTHINGASITTNFRVIIENNWLDDLKYICEPTEFHEKRLSMKVITDIGVTREFNRHRTFSIVEQSTRYCNFSKDKFGKEITFIIPSWLKCKDIDCKSLDVMNSLEFKKYCLGKKSEEFVYTLGTCEWHYLRLLQQGLKPQEARQVLPLSTKTEVVYTAFESDWREWFAQRLFGKTGEPHPQIKQLAELIKQEFEKAGVWEGIMKYPSKYENLF